MKIAITSAVFDSDAELAAFSAQKDNSGALVSFTGICRSDDGAIKHLELQHYPGFTEAEIARLAGEAAQRHQLLDLLVIHRVGIVPAGETIVLVAARAIHRTAAFNAVSDLMDALKTDAPVWKRELGASGARWIEPTASDCARREARK